MSRQSKLQKSPSPRPHPHHIHYHTFTNNNSMWLHHAANIHDQQRLQFTGTLSYDWNLGANNGWIYLGSPAPTITFTTSTNSISITPSSTATSLSNVQVTVKLNGTARPPLTSTVTYSRPTYNLAIEGSSNICSSEDYMVSGLPSGSTVSWQAPPSRGLSVKQSTSGNTLTISRINTTATGSVVIAATVTTACGTYSVQQSNVYVGPRSGRHFRAV